MQVIKKFQKVYQNDLKKKTYKNNINTVKFVINTNHKYPKYENMFKNFFKNKKQKVLQNSKYWTEDYYNFLKSFVMYTEWLFTDLENRNYENIKSYVDYFKRVVRKLKLVK